jgi:ABC-2 type transport system permease protein
MQRLTLLLPSRHFVRFSRAIIFRDAGFESVWQPFLAVGAIGLAFFAFRLRQLRHSIAVTKQPALLQCVASLGLVLSTSSPEDC